MKEVGVKRWVLEGTELRLSTHDQQDSRGVSEGQGRQGRGHLDRLHAVRPRGLQGRVAAIKKFGSAGKKTAVVLHDQRRRQRAVLQGLGNQKVSAEDIPVVAFSSARRALRR